MTAQLGSTDLKRLHRSWRKRAHGRLAVLLDGLQSPFNVGAIVRTAAAYRVEHIWLTAQATPLDNAKVGRTAMGCERFLTWGVLESIAEVGMPLVGLELADGAVPIHEADLPRDFCLAVGHEDRGLAKGTLAACDQVVYVPQLGRIGSLNVAAATAIALYEARRREWSVSSDP